MRVTLKDVVEKTGVSRSVVSMYLNKDPRVRLTDEKKKRIDKAVLELGYRPSLAACTLRKGRSRMLGMVLGGVTNSFFSHFAEACLMYGEIRGYQLLISLTQWDHEKERRSLENLIERQVDGIIYALHLSGEQEFFRKIHGSRIPVAVLNQKEKGFLSVLQNQQKISMEIIKNFQNSRHRRVICCCYPNNYLEQNFIEAGRNSGMECEIMHIGNETMETVTNKFLEKRVSALYMADRRSAEQLLAKIQERNLDYNPEIVTTYNFPVDLIDDPRIIGYVFGNFYNMAKATVDILIDNIEGKDGKVPNTICVNQNFYRRDEFFKIKDTLIDSIKKAERTFV